MSPGKDFYGRSPLGWGRAGIILLSFWFSGHWMQAFFGTFFDDFRVFWGSGRGGDPLRDHFLGSSCGGGPAGGRKVVFGVLWDGFVAPFWEPQWPFWCLERG